ncbi:hypothetical protein DCAR_0729900 [Daucus carota subsp. sativus]|uniref:HNH domain-containing protein n=1 Tax=Daucus carota subsp. sativus TaxID=79200 RepID=A0AAF1BBS1_DAUCS|nr:PREDICTED: uncharacterized protein LOC108193590 [Daucus carota subsp. sativus]WOH10431.1 hypothetical protein DCAR_0729900 [Daucus carota subsp. sativus]
MSSEGSTSPPRRGTASGSGGKEDRPRSFGTTARAKCWANAQVVPGRHPERWRQDAAGNIVCKRFGSCQGCLCFEYDHIIPYSKGGESVAENCQILQTRVNRFKSDKEAVGTDELQQYACDIKFSDRELDVIEMAVYGDVIRPGNECRCRTVAEMLGKLKSKDRTAACKLPTNDGPRT